jgi:ribose 5-phosphate isomerase A
MPALRREILACWFGAWLYPAARRALAKARRVGNLPPSSYDARGLELNGMGEIMDASDQNRWKKAAAEAAAKLVKSGMIIGLGTGSTAAFVVSELGRRVAQEGLRIVGIPTSEHTAEQARILKIPLATLAEHTEIDLTIDGADEVERGTLYLIKGHGGALLREKIVAAASKRMAVVADETKLVERLGTHFSVPVEVVPYGWQATERKLSQLGANPALRLGADRKPYVTDGGHYIVDCAYGPIEAPEEVAEHLDHVVGAVEHGLFLGFASQVFVGGHGGVKVLTPKAGSSASRRARSPRGQRAAS